MRSWSLRVRLVAVMITLLTLGCLAMGVTTELTLQASLYDRVDAQLTSAAGRAPRSFQPGSGTGATGTDAPQDCARSQRGDGPPGQTIGTLVGRICHGDIDVAILVEQGQREPDVGAFDAALLAVPVDAAPRTLGLGSLGDYRLVARTMPDGSVIITGLPLRESQQTLYLVAGVVGAVAVVIVLSVGLAGAVIVRRTLRPLSRVAATATRVAELRLDHGDVHLATRVPTTDTDPHTEVGQVGAALNNLLDHVHTALERRHASEQQVRQFVADASHELRTPLAAIRGYAELSRRNPNPADTPHILRRVESEANRMTALVEDLLLLARLDAGRPLTEESLDLSALTIDAVSDAHAAGPQHDWQLHLPDAPVTVVGDPARLHQALANLLGNARAHTPEGTTVTTTVTTTDAEAHIRVTDHGPGIDPGLLPHVFERFARGDTSRSRAAGSTGLGLSIVDAVVTAHHGTVTVDSRPGATTFTVRLPLARAAGAGAGSLVAAHPMS